MQPPRRALDHRLEDRLERRPVHHARDLAAQLGVFNGFQVRLGLDDRDLQLAGMGDAGADMGAGLDGLNPRLPVRP